MQLPMLFQKLLNTNVTGPRATTPVFVPLPLGSTAQNRVNPFMAALNTQSPEFQRAYGVNKPLEKPAYFGTHNGRQLVGGARLFVSA